MTSRLHEDLALIRRARILFSHHSVGGNVLSGVEQLDVEAGGGRLSIVPVDAAPPAGPVLAHMSGGRNRDPESKIQSFARALLANSLEPEIAFMKLCYTDIEPQTDIEALFSRYENALEKLKQEHPRIRFAHVTVPLVRRPSGVKASLRRLVGLEVWDDLANVKRNEFNRRLEERLASDPIFDLARVEAMGPDGRATTFERDGHRYLSLYPGYTDDGGHLNSLGQRVAGAAAIRFLAEALETRADR